jgi:hypothetical protein
MKNDWLESPFIDIKVSDSECKDGYEDMFSYEWAGLSAYCKVEGMAEFMPYQEPVKNT